MNMPISQTGSQPWAIPSGGPVPNEEVSPSGYGLGNSSFYESLAEAFRLVGEGAYEQQTKEMQRNLQSWMVNLQEKRQAAFDSANAEKGAAWWRFGAEMACGAMSLGASAINLGFTGAGGKAFKDMGKIESPLENKLNLAKLDLKNVDMSAEGAPQAMTAAREAVAEARQELHDMRNSTDIAAFRQSIERSTTVSNLTRSVNDGLGGWSRAGGNILAADDEVDKKKLDVKAQMDDANSQYAMQLVNNRRADTTKTTDQLDRMQTALAQISQNATRGLAGA
jgi:hypothetical protein